MSIAEPFRRKGFSFAVRCQSCAAVLRGGLRLGLLVGTIEGAGQGHAGSYRYRRRAQPGFKIEVSAITRPARMMPLQARRKATSGFGEPHTIACRAGPVAIREVLWDQGEGVPSIIMMIIYNMKFNLPLGYYSHQHFFLTFLSYILFFYLFLLTPPPSSSFRHLLHPPPPLPIVIGATKQSIE